MNMTSRPREQLVGRTLSDGWVIQEMIDAPNGATGGNFGSGYRATKGNDVAFVKAIDFVGALSASDPIAELAALSSLAIFERDVVEYCTARGMSRILKFLGHEYLWVGDPSNPLNRVSCLILEAGSGDLRHAVQARQDESCAWNLQVLRDIAQALSQLHAALIAHHDIKPANVIAFGADSGAANVPVKLGDLGRVVRRDKTGPFDSLLWSGDSRYSPPERWYGFVPRDWNDAREAADAYMLGSLLFYLFTGMPIQVLVKQSLPVQFSPDEWRGGFDNELLPVLVSTHANVIENFLKATVPAYVWDEVSGIAFALLHPNPSVRGDRRARASIGHFVGIDRIYQRLTTIALRCVATERSRRRT